MNSDFLSGALILMLTGGMLALCRKVPIQLWNFLLRRFTIVVDVTSDDPVFSWISLWLAQHPYSLKARALTATSERDDYGRVSSPVSSENAQLPQILLTPAPGNHLLRYNQRLVWLSRQRKETPGKDDSLMSAWKREVFTLRIMGRSQEAGRKLLEDARSVAINRRHRKLELYFSNYDNWQQLDERDPRPLSSIFLPEGVTEKIVADLKGFIDGRNWYVQRGIPWQRTYLFHGIPGSGKTSLVIGLAGYFRANLYLLSLGNPYLTDDVLVKLMGSVPGHSFILLEDLDAAFNQRNKSDEHKNKLTFSGLLNALNGAGTKEGAVVFMTTNHVERLDPALVRAGRADYKQEFTHAGIEQANRMFLAFFPEAGGADGFGDRVSLMRWSMADVQNHLIEHRDSPVRALNTLNDGNGSVSTPLVVGGLR